MTVTRAQLIRWGVIALLTVAAFFALRAWLTHGAQQQAATAKVEGKLSDARAQAGADAVETVGNEAARESASDTLTRENDDAIHAAPGAAAPVDPGVAAAGLKALCRRHAYASDQRCKGNQSGN